MRWEPRLVGARAWISSMMTVSTFTRVSRTADVSMRYSDSGVVMRRSGGRRASACLSFADVSPVRIATTGSLNGTPSRSAASEMPASGARRFFSTSNASARSGETYSTRVRCFAGGGSVVMRRSREERNAVSVLPEPVGAQISVCAPPTMAGQPCTWGAVGSGKEVANHSRTAGENACSTLWSAMARGYSLPAPTLE